MDSINDAIIIAASSFVAFILAYFLYAEFISRRLFGLRKDASVPSSEMEDGIDYVPTLRHILMGHHFTSIAGAAPIVGPAIAVVWGWLPALIWVVVGSIFIGAVHDFGAVVISIRNQGRSIGDIASEHIGHAGWALFLLIIFSLLAVVIAVFAWIIAGLFIAFPSSVVPIWIEIPLAIWLGTMIYRRKKGTWFWSLVVVALMFVAVGIGTIYPVRLAEVTVGEGTPPRLEAPAETAPEPTPAETPASAAAPAEAAPEGAMPPTEATIVPTDAPAPPAPPEGVAAEPEAETPAPDTTAAAPPPPPADTTPKAVQWLKGVGVTIRNLLQGPAGARKIQPITVWLILLLIYAFTASQLPVQTLLQPRDFINAYKLYISMALLCIGICLVPNLKMVAPVYRPTAEIPGAKPMLPMLFVIIACGAVSGFHSLVASGTTSKQLKHETDAKMVGYGSMLVEGALAVIVIIACCAGIGLGFKGPDGLLTGKAAYDAVYSTWETTNAGKLGAFIQGGGQFLSRIGIPLGFATTLMAVILVSFAATTLDTATRIQRYVIVEIGQVRPLAFLKNRTLATFIAVLTAGWIAVNQGARGSIDLWRVFGTVNQLLAGLALMTITLYLARKGKSVWFTLPPMVFVLVVTGWAMILQIVEYRAENNELLLYLAVGVFVLELGVLAAGLTSAVKLRKQRQAQAEAERKVDDALGGPPEDTDEAPAPVVSADDETQAENGADVAPEDEPEGPKEGRDDDYVWEAPSKDEREPFPLSEDDSTDVDIPESDNAPLDLGDQAEKNDGTTQSSSDLHMGEEERDRDFRLREEEGTHIDDGDAKL